MILMPANPLHACTARTRGVRIVIKCKLQTAKSYKMPANATYTHTHTHTNIYVQVTYVYMSYERT